MSEEHVTDSLPRKSVMAAVAGILGLISFFIGLTGIPAVILGHIGWWRISRSGGMLEGRGLCVFALIMGYLSIALGLHHRSK